MASQVVGSAVYELTLNQTQYTRGLATAERAAQQAAAGIGRGMDSAERATQQSVKQMTGHLASLKSALGNVVTLAAGFALGQGLVAGLGQLKGAINAASDLNETLNKSSVVFGDAARDVERFGDTAAKALGQSKEQAIGAAAGFGNLFVSMGMAKRPAAQMSMSIVTLASDLASFNNLDPAEVLEGLRAGLVGETEPLRRFGVNVNQANIEARAMKLGLMEVGGELTASAKAQATYSLILEQTTTAQGDFKNTSTGMANSTRIIKAELVDMAGRIGGKVLPTLAPLVSAFAQKLPDAIDAVASVLGRVGGRISDVANLLKGPLQTAIEAVSRPFGIARDTVLTFVEALKGDWVSASGILPLHAIVGELGGAFRHVWDDFNAAFDMDRWRGVIAMIPTELATIGPALRTALVTSVTEAWAWISGPGRDDLALKLQAWKAAFLGWVNADDVIGWLKGVVQKVSDWATGDGLTAVKLAFGGWKGVLWSWITTEETIAKLKGWAQSVVAWVTGDGATTVGGALFGWKGALVAWIVPNSDELLTKLQEWGQGVVTWFTDTGLPWFRDTLVPWARSLWEWVEPQIGPLLEKLGKLLARLGVWIWDVALPWIVDHLKKWGSAFWEWVEPQIDPLMEKLGKLLARLSVWFVTVAVPKILDLLQYLAQEIGKWLVSFVDGFMAGLDAEFQKKQDEWIAWGKAAIANFIDGAIAGLESLWHKIQDWVDQHVITPTVKFFTGLGQGGGIGTAGTFGPPGEPSAAGFIKPIAGTYVQGSYVGTHSRESAMDWAAPRGTAVVAPMSGTVSAVGYNLDGNSGRGLVIDHPGGWTTRYGHMSAIVVNPGATVAQGSIIGYSGSPEMDGGAGSGAHLHLALQQNGRYVDAAENYIPMARGGVLIGEAGPEVVMPFSGTNPVPVLVTNFDTGLAEQRDWWERYAEKTWGAAFVEGAGGLGGEFFSGTAARDLTDAIDTFNDPHGSAADLTRAIDTFDHSVDGFVEGGGAIGKDFISGADKLLDASEMLTDAVLGAVRPAEDLTDALNTFTSPGEGWMWGGGAATPGGVFDTNAAEAAAKAVAEATATPATIASGGGGGTDLDLVRAQNRYLADHPGTAIGLARTMTQAELEAGGYYQDSSRQRMALGGVIAEPIAGLGLRTGRRYLFAENGPETVTPGTGPKELRMYGNMSVYVQNPQDSVDAVIRALTDR